MRIVLFVFVTTTLVSQSYNSHGEALLSVAPPVIVMEPAGQRISVMLLATGALPRGTDVLPVITIGKTRNILPSIQISGPGVYALATVPNGSEIIAYVTPPAGNMYTLRSAAIVRGFKYDRQMLAIYGDFTKARTLVYVGTSLIPVRPTIREGYLELALKPTGAVTNFTVYQAEGLCDSVLVRLK